MIQQGGASRQRVSLSMCGVTENISPFFSVGTVGGILIRSVVQYTVFCEPKELYNTVAADTRLNPYPVLLRPERNDLPVQYKEGLDYLSVCAIASRSFRLSKCVVVTVARLGIMLRPLY
jgi:hypothetical protein